jgi:hypothetical protein
MIQQWEAEKQSSSLDTLDHIAVVAVYKQITRLDHFLYPVAGPVFHTQEASMAIYLQMHLGTRSLSHALLQW